MVTDFDCWHPDHEAVSVEQVIKTLLSNAEKAKKVVAEVLMSFEEDIDAKDPTNHCLDVAIITDKKVWTKETIKNLSNIAGRVLNK
jgi:5'-methylthioadenosine phosphorylase